jgi:5-methylcytosine-specific restriction protein B
MNEEEIKNGVKLLCDTSLKVQSYYESADAIVDALNHVSKDDLAKCIEYYSDRNGVVIDLRKELIQKLYDNEKITVESLQNLLNKHKKGKEKQYKSYKNLYSIFFPPITFYGHNNARDFVAKFIKKLITDLELSNHVETTSFDFQGPRQQGSDRYWIALYNKTQKNQSSSLQVFIEFYKGTIGYGIYEHKSKSYLKPKIIKNPTEFSYEIMLNYFIDQKELIINDILKPSSLKEIDLGTNKLYKVSHGSFKANKDKHIVKALKDNNWITIHETTGKNRGSNFKNKLKKGDYVYITLGSKELIYIARITSDKCNYVPSEITNAEGWLYREIEEIQYPTSKKLKELTSTKAIYPSGNTSLFEIKESELKEANELLFKPYFNTLFTNKNISNTYETEQMETNKPPLNQILYGPPGTGKTYKTKKLAVEIIENQEYSDSKEDREIILGKYAEYTESENIHFTTFHQSLSYEDFIEGIKPVMNEDEEKELSYEIQDGIFKAICKKASKVQNSLKKDTGKTVEIDPFDTAWGKMIEEIQEKVDNSGVFNLKTKSNIENQVVEISDKGNLYLKPFGGNEKEYTVSYNRTKKLFNAFSDLSVVKNIDKEFRQVIGGSNSTAYWSVLNYLHLWIEENQEQIIVEEIDKILDTNQNYVLIIDEINRGNVSAIFGELLTLIETDKRAGEKEAISVTLPYSKTKFSVPNNVFIIGTMNTADRSVEALDTALRRRFSFEEILPKPQLLEDLDYKEVNLKELLEAINQRIELLIDKDHQIGHSYFLCINNFDDLKLVFKDKIIPLLEEYFYGDFGKIGLVLGENFIEQQAIKNSSILASFKGYDDIDFVTDKKIFRFKKPINEMEVIDFMSIYKTIEN